MLHKEETAHDDSIWSCTWGRRLVEKTKKSKEIEDDAELMDEDKSEDENTEAEYKDFIVTGGLDDYVKIWDVNDEKLKLRYSMAGHSLGVVSVTVSSDGKSRRNCLNFIFWLLI